MSLVSPALVGGFFTNCATWEAQGDLEGWDLLREGAIYIHIWLVCFIEQQKEHCKATIAQLKKKQSKKRKRKAS